MLNESETRIVQLIGRMYFLTAGQVVRRYYSAGSKTLVGSYLKALTESGYLTRRGFKPSLQGGSYPYVYSLSPKGRRELVRTGYLPNQRYRPSEEEALRTYPDHTLAINDVLIAGELSGKLTRFVHERTINRIRPPYRPDGYLECGNTGFLLEVDRDTEAFEFWDRKIARLCAFVGSDNYTKYFELFEGVLVVVPDQSRLDLLTRWTKASLDRLGLPDWLQLFRFLTHAEACDPERLAQHL